jgi:serine phosphatase RsbU (regulator of sigma subunit)
MKLEESLKPSGTTLSAKIIFSMALVVAISCAIFIIVSVILVTKEIENELNSKGLNVAKLIASIDFKAWEALNKPDIRFGPLDKLIKQYQQRAEGTNDNYERHLLKGVIEDLQSEKLQIARGNKKSVDEKEYKNPLEDFIKGGGDILYIAVVEGIGNDIKPVIAADIANQKTRTFSGLVWKREEDYEVSDTYYTYNNRDIPVKIFSYQVRGANNNPIGKVLLVMSKSAFTQTKIRVVRTLLIPLLIALGTSILIGGVMSSKIVSPIKELISDINEISQGNLDHRATIKSSDEIGLIGVAFNRMTKSLKLYMQEVVNRAVITQEYEAATMLINEYLLKIKEKPRIPNLDVSVIYYPSKDVSGDYYDYDIIDSNKLYILVSDVSGKGLAASLVSTVFKNLVLHELEQTQDPKEILIKANRTLRKTLKKGMFVTVSFLVYNIEKVALTVYSAGHLPILIYRPSEGKVIEVNPPGIAIGLDQKLFERKLESVTVSLRKGDRFISYSDGITEAQDVDNRCFGLDRLKEILIKYPNKTSTEFIHIVSKEINDFTDGAIVDNRLFDDITLVTGRVI